MTTQDIGWHFPPTSGGTEDGWNDSGIALFRGATLASFAREILQNSIDARVEEPVEVSFEIATINRKSDDEWRALSTVIDACRRHESADEKAQQELKEAADVLRSARLTFLRVADQNTTGLHGRHWRALVKQRGVNTPEQREQAGGGSHGQGKSAAFLFSPLRTILYWSRFDGPSGPVELCQGKSILMTHLDPAEQDARQGTGFFGIVDQCLALDGFDIPEFVRRKEYGGNRGNGTSLWIAGFDDSSSWQQDIAKSVIANFFYAIDNGQLVVTIEPDEEMAAQGLIEISADTIDDWYDFFRAAEQPDADDSLTRSSFYRDIVENGQPVECDDPDLGHCSLWIRVSDELPRTVAWIRRTGMLITDQQSTSGIKQFYGFRPFAAVCQFDSEKGNRLLRSMENPRHDQFEPGWLPTSDQERGAKALERIAGWIRDEIKKVAEPPKPTEVTSLNELARFLPDIDPDDEFGHNAPGEPLLGGLIKVKPKKSREPDRPPAPPSPGAVSIYDVRVVPVESKENHFLFSFTAAETAQVRLRLEEAGDSNPIPRDDLEATHPDGSNANLNDFSLLAEQRIELSVTSSQPIGDRAWRVVARKVDHR